MHVHLRNPSRGDRDRIVDLVELVLEVDDLANDAWRRVVRVGREKRLILLVFGLPHPNAVPQQRSAVGIGKDHRQLDLTQHLDQKALLALLLGLHDDLSDEARKDPRLRLGLLFHAVDDAIAVNEDAKNEQGRPDKEVALEPEADVAAVV